jgi:hypothetical protein
VTIEGLYAVHKYSDATPFYYYMNGEIVTGCEKSSTSRMRIVYIDKDNIEIQNVLNGKILNYLDVDMFIQYSLVKKV